MVFHSLLRNTFKQKCCKCHLLLLPNHSRMVSSYGIQTNKGIFEIKKSKTNTHKDISSNLSWMKDKKYLEFYQCEKTLHPVEQLLTLHKFEQLSKSTLLKGFIKGEGFLPSVVQMTNQLEFNKGNLELCKTVFEILDNGTLAMLNVRQGNEHDYYHLQDYDGPHPVFEDPKFAPVYKNFDQAKTNLSKVCTRHESLEVKNMLNTLLKKPNTIGHSPKHPFIVVEGLDGTGKSTMTQNLGKFLGAEILGTPPASIKHIRKYFDVFPELCRRSFYAYGNYVAAEEIIQILQSRPVVLDRYYHSTTAYAIAKDSGFGIEKHLPSKGNPLYSWPNDLLRPSAVVFLTTEEKERDERMNIRDERTEEENELRDSQMFRKRIMEAYRRINLKGGWVEVDTGGTQEESLQKAVNGLKQIDVL